MGRKVYRVEAKKDYVLETTFFNGDVKSMDMKAVAETFPEYSSVVANKSIFQTVEVDKSKSKIQWKNGIKLDVDMIWYDGTVVEIINIEDAAIRFADRMLCVREALWLTQKDLEQRTGIHQADISKIERGEANPSLQTMKRIAEGMGKVLKIEFVEPKVIRRPNIPLCEAAIPYVSEYKCQGEYTVRDIMAIPEGINLELIDGVIYDMAPPNFAHQEILSYFNYVFADYIFKNKGQCKVVQAPTGLEFENDDQNFFLPDLMVICDKKKIQPHGVVGAPDFVMEVISKSTGKRDYSTKLIKFTKEGVREYWILDPYKKVLIVYDLENDACPCIHSFDEVVEVNIYGGKLKIDLSAIKGMILE